MNRRFFLAAVTPLFALAAPLPAQGPGDVSDRLNPGEAAAKPAKPTGPTEITARDATLDNKASVAVFGGNVEVKSPEYHITCDKLTIYLKKDPEKPKPGDPKPAAAGKENDGQTGGRIDKAIAEGNVKIIQTKAAVGNGKPETYVGIGKRAVFENDKQLCTLTGWPRVQQNVDNVLSKEIVSLEEGCVIVMSPDRIDVLGGRATTRLIDQK